MTYHAHATRALSEPAIAVLSFSSDVVRRYALK